MSNKTPFEIRTDLLVLAKDYLDRQHDINVQFAQEAFYRAAEAGKVTLDSWKQYVPSQYTIDDLIKKAREMSNFINSKDQ